MELSEKVNSRLKILNEQKRLLDAYQSLTITLWEGVTGFGVGMKGLTEKETTEMSEYVRGLVQARLERLAVALDETVECDP